MSSVIRQIKYICPDPCFYGSCNKPCAFIVESHGVSDTVDVWHLNCSGKLVHMFTVSDDVWEILATVFTKKWDELDSLSAEEYQNFRNLKNKIE